MKTQKKIAIVALFTIWTFILVAGCVILMPQAYEMAKSYIEANKLKEAAQEANRTGLDLVNQGNVEEGITYFEKALEYANQYHEKMDNSYVSGTLFSDAYNNIGYAYYLLGNLELSKFNLEKALSIEPNDAYEYSNMGNTYLDLGDKVKALKQYELAIDCNSNALYAYYGKGQILYEDYKYEDARQMFEKYLEYEPYDVDALRYIIYCYLYNGDTEKALELADEAIGENQGEAEFYIAKAEILRVTKDAKEVKEYYEHIAQVFQDDVDVQIQLGSTYYDNGDYEVALEQFLKTKERFPDNTDVDSWIITCYSALDDMDRAAIFFQEILDAGNASCQLCNDMGQAYSRLTYYMESIPYYEKAINLSPESLDAYINTMYSLYYGRRYQRCIEFGKSIEEKFNTSYDIPTYIGDCYYALGDFEEAITAYQRALIISPEDEYLLSSIGDAYLYLEDYQSAEKYAKEALAANPYNLCAQNTITKVSDKQDPIVEQIKEFVKANYLYNQPDKDMEEKIDRLFNEESMSNLDIAIAVDDMKLYDDMFTFTLFDEYYDEYYYESLNDVEYTCYGDINYIRFNDFNMITDSKVIEILDSIENPESKILVFDLRENYGGLIQAAADILDALLFDCVSCTLFYGDGCSYNYYSDASQIRFKEIHVLVDQDTASSAELLALGLKTYLNNVTIIGQNTFGKGVGQLVFEDKERKLMVYLVNFYWNVRQQNILGTSILPDIHLESEELEDYLEIIRQ